MLALVDFAADLYHLVEFIDFAVAAMHAAQVISSVISFTVAKIQIFCYVLVAPIRKMPRSRKIGSPDRNSSRSQMLMMMKIG